MAKFGNLKQFDIKGCEATFGMPIGYSKADGTKVYSKLHMRHAGDSNKAWQNAINRHNAKTGLARRAASGQGGTADIARARDQELYPKLIITGWEDVVDEDGKQVPFTEENCTEYIAALPQWVFDEVRGFAVTATNFLPEDVPSKIDIEDQAGN